MGTKLFYRPGSFYRCDDRTGFSQRAERTRKEWTGLIVDETVWEARQPQDFVKGVADNQTVPEPRPRAPNLFVGPISVALASAASPGASSVVVTTTAGLTNGNSVGLMLDNGWVLRTTINAPVTSTTISLATALPGPAASGNLLIDYDG